jgi:dihydrofolate reductase
MFEPAWSSRTVEDDPGAPFFNETPKYVVSGTLKNPTWSNSQVLGPYDARTIREFKDGLERDVYISGSGQLVRGLLADGLVDELHLFMFPVALGSGARLFTDEVPLTKLTLGASESYENGVLHLDYRPAA